MGLDQYLHKKTYIGNKNRDPQKRVRIVIPQDQEGVFFPTKNVKEERISEIVEEVGYWRKANAIHQWFVDNVQGGNDDCGEYSVSQEKLKELLEIVTKVLDKPNLASQLLPTQSGFFFGDTEYDEYYKEYLQDTKTMLEEILKEEGDFYYSSSW